VEDKRGTLPHDLFRMSLQNREEEEEEEKSENLRFSILILDN
jgi:hypothetical protein